MGRKKALQNRDSLILDAAATLFSARSYEKTTLDEIAVQAGISKGSIYLEFPSKEEILCRLFQRNKEIELAEMRRIASDDKIGALFRLKTMLITNLLAIYDSVQQNQLSMEEILQTRKHLYAKLKPYIEARLDLLEELLKRAERQGEISPLTHHRRTAELIMLALRALRPPYMDALTRDSLQRDADEIIELLIDGLQ